MRKTGRTLAVLILLGLRLSACSEKGMIDPSSETGTVSFKLAVAETKTRIDETPVRSGLIKLIHPDSTRFISLNISGNQASATVYGIFAGDWTAQVQLYDENENLIYSGSTPFTVSAVNSTRITTITIAPHSGDPLFTKPDIGNIEIGFTLPVPVVDDPKLILWNKLGCKHQLQNSAVGPNLSSTAVCSNFAPGKWGRGLDCSQMGKKWPGDITIPQNTIPMSDFSIEFWYKKTRTFVEGDIATFLFSRHTPLTHHTNTFHVMITTPWQPYNFGSFYWLRFGVRINNSNTKEVIAYHNFGCLDAVNRAFPLNTPVHIAVTKRNTDGRLQIFINGTQMKTEYTTFNEPYYTSDTSCIANKSGYFPAKTFIGQCDSAVTGSDTYNAKGIIDNLKIYNFVKDSFCIDSE